MKKLLSIILCLAMLAGMLPAVFATETTETATDGTITLDFSTDNLTLTGGNTGLSQWTVKDNAYSFLGAFCIATAEASNYTATDNSTVTVNRFGFRANFSTAGLLVADANGVTTYDRSKFQYDSDLGGYTYSAFPGIIAVSNANGSNWKTWPTVEKSITVSTNIPSAGLYEVNMTGYQYGSGSLFSIYVNDKYTGDFNFYNSSVKSVVTEKLNVISLPKDDVRISFKLRKNFAVNSSGKASYQNLLPIKLELIPVSSDYEHKIEKVVIPELASASNTFTLDVGESKNMSAQAQMMDGTLREFGYTSLGKIPTSDDVITVTSSDSDVVSVSNVVCVEVDEANSSTTDGVVGTQTIDPTTTTYTLTANAGGSADITVTALVDGMEKSTTFKVLVPEDISSSNDYTSAAHSGADNTSITAYAVYGKGGTIEDTNKISTGYESNLTFGDVCESISAPDAPEGYKFLYWAKGLSEKKQILTYDAELLDYRPTEGTNYLIAVYEAESEETEENDRQEFYNANGQLLDVGITNGVMPDYPSMPGYGKAVGWALKGEGDTYTECKAGETAPETDGKGTMIFMAIYNDLEKNITVTVNGTADKYAYGDPVTCTAEASTADGEFMYWKKNGKIASVEQDYKFLAFTDSTVEAVYGGGIETLSEAFRNIILTRFTAGDATAIMAEFIGFEDDVEKGIMFGSTKLAMTTDGNQFAVIDDWNEETTATGYAIVRDGNNLKKITDGKAYIGKTDEEIIQARRDAAVQYMKNSVSLLWTPAETVTYSVGSSFNATLEVGKTYKGLPYVYNAGTTTGFLDFAGEQNATTGVYTISGLTSEMMSGTQGDTRVGNDCSGAIERAWHSIGASVQAKATRYMVPANGFIKVGDYAMEDGLTDYKNYENGTYYITEQNGKDKMYAAYAQLKKGDAVVHYTGTAGHSMMVVDVNIKTDENGDILPTNSTITILEQTRDNFTAETPVTETIDGVGEVYVIGGEEQWTFQALYNNGYLPITCRALVDANYIDDPVVSDSIAAPSIDNLFTGTISSNRAIDRVTVDITGNDVSQSATASFKRTTDIFKFSMEQFEEDAASNKLKGSIDTSNLASGTYKCTVTVTLVDGTEFTVCDFNFTK